MIVCEFSVVPLGRGESVSAEVAQCLRIVRESGLSHQLTAMGTLLEGEWDEVMAVVRRCHEAVRARNRRVLTTIRIDDRDAPPGRLQAKVRSVEEKLARA
ncbi:MTH1187 family thiamine-binding protein [Candidatus Bipolaricaulota bacterium]|nr:MTH1187 family thiamine-binding protein [Candidatus Bipolaricaulota bacterium]